VLAYWPPDISPPEISPPDISPQGNFTTGQFHHPFHFTTINPKINPRVVCTHSLSVQWSLKGKFGLKKKILKWDWVRFCLLYLTKSNTTHFKIFFQTKFPFQALTESDTHLV
jgi:hypothetical protein